jgi:hypothetical protein
MRKWGRPWCWKGSVAQAEENDAPGQMRQAVVKPSSASAWNVAKAKPQPAWALPLAIVFLLLASSLTRLAPAPPPPSSLAPYGFHSRPFRFRAVVGFVNLLVWCCGRCLVFGIAGNLRGGGGGGGGGGG